MADGTRTRDVLDHNQVLYQLNYSHHRALASNGLTVAVLRRRGKFRSPLPLLNTSRPPHHPSTRGITPQFLHSPSTHLARAFPRTIAFSRKRTPHRTSRLAQHSTQHHTCAARHMHHTNTWGQLPTELPPHSHFSADHQKARTAMASAKFPSASGVASKYRSASTSDTSITWKDPSLSGTTSTRLNSSCSSRPIRERM